MKHVSSALRICISTGAVLAALAPRPGLAESEVCTGPGMALFEREAGISALDATGTWLRVLPVTGTLASMGTVERLQSCADADFRPDFRVSPHGEQLITWQHETEILSVTSAGTVVTRLPEGERLWAADAAFVGAEGLAVIAALLYRDGEEPRLTITADAAPVAGLFSTPPFEVTGADCGLGPAATSATSAGEVMVLCQGSFTAFRSTDDGGFDIATFPLELPDAELVVAAAKPEPSYRATFFAIIRDTMDEIDPVYELVRIRVNSLGNRNVERVLDDVAYAGGDHGLAVIDDWNVVYMDEEGMRHVTGTRDDWSTSVIHPLRPEASLAALAAPPRVLISDHDAELLTLTDEGWQHETLFALGTPLAPASGGDPGCSMAGTDPATGLGQALLVMLALALVTAPRLARGRGPAHDAACSSCWSGSSRSRGPSR